MASVFDDLVPVQAAEGGRFADLIPAKPFDDLIPTKPAPEPTRSFVSRIWYGLTHPGEVQSAEIPFTQREVTAGTAPQLGEAPPQMLPRAGEPGTFARGLSDVAAGLVEGAVTPEGQLLVGAAAVPPLAPLVRAVTAGIGIKSTLEGFKEGAKAFDTSDKEAAGRAVGQLLTGAAMVRGSVVGLGKGGEPVAETVKPAETAAVTTATPAEIATAPVVMRAEVTGPIADRVGIVPAGAIVNHLQNLPSVLEGKLRQISGETMPKTTMANREAGEAGARYGSSQIYAPYAARSLSYDVLPESSGIDPAQFGAALTEQNLRGRRQVFQRQANAEAASGNVKEAARLQELADNVSTMVGQKGIFATEADLQSFVAKPEVQAAVDRLQDLYTQRIDPLAEQAGLDPTVKPEVGDLFPQQKGFINLFVPQEGGVPSTRTVAGVNPVATMKRGTKFQRQRTGASDRYGVNFHDMVANAYGGFIEVARKNEFDQKLVDAGLAVIGDEKPGPDYTFFPYERNRILGLENGDIVFRKNQRKNIWVRNDLAEEYSTVSNLYRNPFGSSAVATAGGVLTRVQMAGIVDAVFHTQALLKGLEESVSAGTIADPAMSLLLRADLIPKAARLVKTAFLDPLERQERLASLANIGSLSKLEPYSWQNPVKSIVRWTEENVRLTLDDIFTELANEGKFANTETNRREFINRGLQYNMRFQGPAMRVLRQTGIGPFATAGRAGLARGARGLAFSEWATPEGLPNRAWVAGNIATKVAGTALLVGTLNYLTTGEFGGREGTPLGNVDTNRDDDDGRPMSVPLANLLGNTVRGARIVGLRALATARQQDLTWDQTLDAMFRESINTIIHPAAGPALQFGVGVATGKHVGVDLPEFPKAPPGESQVLSNLKVAGEQLNPAIAGAEKMLGIEPEKSPLEGLGSSSIVVKGTKPEKFENMAKIVTAGQINDFADDVAKRARRLPISERRDFLREQKERLDPELQRQYEKALNRLHPALLKRE